MKKAYIKILLVVLISTLVLVGCTTETTTPEQEELELTIAELSEFNGADGNKAYIAVDGIIYDVTDVPPWSGGTHNGFESGKDLTEEIKTISPHGVSKLANVPQVGKLVD